VTPCGSCKNRCFVGMYHPHHHGGKNHWVRNVSSNYQLKHTVLLITANAPSLLIFSTLMIEAISSSETSVLTRATWCHIPEDSIFQLQTKMEFFSHRLRWHSSITG
jgi:hypothetical protein